MSTSNKGAAAFCRSGFGSTFKKLYGQVAAAIIRGGVKKVILAGLTILALSHTYPVSGKSLGNPVLTLPCQDCHGELTLKYRHAPVEDDCLNCHTQHFDKGAGRYNLEAEGNELCGCCHLGLEELGGHPVANHPTSGPHDPWDKKKPFTCLSCHTPHQSNMPGLFRYEYKQSEDESAFFPCVFCHRITETTFPLPKKPVHLDLFIKNVEK